jgi:Methylase involved in ubiquinone/menaquinone biosynthesis
MDEQVIRQKSLRKFDRDASQYEQTSDGRFCSRAYPAVIKKIAQAKISSFLDVGCGTGFILSQVSDQVSRCGIDLSPQMIERAKQTLKEQAELVVGDAENLPWSDEWFDTVCCTFSFHHYPNPKKVLAEINRVLKKGGRLILADPWMPSLLRQILNALLRYSDDGDYHSYSRREIRQLLECSGFALCSFEHPTNDSFLLTAEKTAGRMGV